MKVPNTPTLLMASLALSSSTLAVPLDKHASQSPNPAGGMSPRSPRLNDGLVAFAGRALDYNAINLPDPMLAPRSPQGPPDALISSSKDVVSQVGGLVSAVGPVLDTVKGLLDGLPGGTAVEGLLDGLGIQLAATKKSADQLSSLVVQNESNQAQNQKRDEDAQDDSQGLIPGIQAPVNTPNPQLYTPNLGTPYLGQAAPIAPPNTPNAALGGLSSVAGLVQGLVPGAVPVAGLGSTLGGVLGGLPLQQVVPNLGIFETLEQNRLLANVDPSGSTSTTSTLSSTPTTTVSEPVPSESAAAGTSSDDSS